jgi:hypothetical protein
MATARHDDFQTPICRLAFSQGLFKARAATEGAPKKYGCTLIFENKHRPVLEEIIKKVIVDEWGEKGLLRAKAGGIKSPLLAGDGKEAKSKQTGEIHPGFGPGLFFIRPGANEDRKPVVRWNSKEMEATQDEVYSGCYGVAVLNCFAWTHPSSGDGVSFGVRMFQKLRDGEPLGGAGPVDVDRWYRQVEDDDGLRSEQTTSGQSAGGLFN